MFFKFVLVLFLSTLLFSTSVDAQQPAPNINPIQQAAVCGGIGQACCQSFRLPVVGIAKPGIIGIDQGIDIVNGLFSGFLNHATGGLNTVIDQFKAGKVCYEGEPTDNNNLNNCFCGASATIDLAKLCSPITNAQEKQLCVACSSKGIWTGIGCVDFSLQSFIQNVIFGWGIGFAGLSTVACIIWAAFSMQFSQGDAAKLKNSQERLTACISGLILILFSVFILRFIGVNLLRIPGFS